MSSRSQVEHGEDLPVTFFRGGSVKPIGVMPNFRGLRLLLDVGSEPPGPSLDKGLSFLSAGLYYVSACPVGNAPLINVELSSPEE